MARAEISHLLAALEQMIQTEFDLVDDLLLHGLLADPRLLELLDHELPLTPPEVAVGEDHAWPKIRQ